MGEDGKQMVGGTGVIDDIDQSDLESVCAVRSRWKNMDEKIGLGRTVCYSLMSAAK